MLNEGDRVVVTSDNSALFGFEGVVTKVISQRDYDSYGVRFDEYHYYCSPTDAHSCVLEEAEIDRGYIRIVPVNKRERIGGLSNFLERTK